MIRTAVSLALVLTLAGSVAHSASSSDPWGKKLGDDAACMSKVKIDHVGGKGNEHGTGGAPYLKALGAPPKRVALVSWYVWDPMVVKKSMGYRKECIVMKTSPVVTGLYGSGIDDLKSTFQQYGMELLTPDEFLDTPEKKDAYDKFEMKHGAMVGVMNFIHGAGRRMNDAGLQADIEKAKLNFDAPEGYRVLDLPAMQNDKQKNYELMAQSGDKKLFESMGHDLATAIGVDAVAVLYNVTPCDQKGISLLSSYFYMFGPNPVKTDDGGAWTGHEYTGAKMNVGVQFLKSGKKGKVESESYEGYGHVAKALATKVCEDLKTRTSGAD